MIPYPENVPHKTGYYYTRYFNPVEDKLLYKALVFNVDLNMWIGPWRWSYDYGPEETWKDGSTFRRIINKPLDVKEYIPESYANYYTECLRICGEL